MLINRNKINYIGEINIVPLLDILLVLVLIFIITSSIFISVLKIDLPDSKSSTFEQTNASSIVIVEILDIDKYNVITNGYRKKKLTLKDISLLIHSEISKNSKTVFLIAGGKNLPYKEIIKVLDILYQADIKTIGFVTKPI